MLKCILTALFSTFILNISAQAVNGSFAFDTDPEKKYSLYIPSNYNPDEPSAMMLGLHPLNVNRWDAEAWRDTLIVFAESNDLILVCPDGGVDGRIDDAIDTAFTSVLVDSVSTWYNVDQSRKYMMGFSWGGKTTYTYGLRRTNDYNGYIIIGAAITILEVADVIENAKDESIYLVHGSNDAVGTNYTPLLETLTGVEACVESNLLSGVGHTIDFPNRNQILTDAFNWVETANCQVSRVQDLSSQVTIFPNPTTQELVISGIDLQNKRISVCNMTGETITTTTKGSTIFLPNNYKGQLILTIADNKTIIVKKILKI